MRFYINFIENGSVALTVEQPHERLVLRGGWEAQIKKIRYDLLNLEAYRFHHK